MTFDLKIDKYGNNTKKGLNWSVFLIMSSVCARLEIFFYVINFLTS